MPSSNTNTPQFQFFNIDGLPFNRLIQLTPECCTLIVKTNVVAGDIALWIHWQQFSQFPLDIDSANAVFAPGLFVGTTPIYKLTAVPAPDGIFYAVKYSCPIIKLKQPVGFFYVTGWIEPSAGGGATALGGNAVIIATNDLQDADVPLMGGA